VSDDVVDAILCDYDLKGLAPLGAVMYGWAQFIRQVGTEFLAVDRRRVIRRG
jgi:hypothetical protein